MCKLLSSATGYRSVTKLFIVVLSESIQMSISPGVRDKGLSYNNALPCPFKIQLRNPESANNLVISTHRWLIKRFCADICSLKPIHEKANCFGGPCPIVDSLSTAGNRNATKACFWAVSYITFHSASLGFLENSSRLPKATCSNSMNNDGLLSTVPRYYLRFSLITPQIISISSMLNSGCKGRVIISS